MTLAALLLALVALAVAGGAIYLAVLSRAEAITCRRELARHRDAHATSSEERRATRRHAAPQEAAPEPETGATALRPQDAPGEPTEALEAQHPVTREVPAVRLPRPGRIGGQR